MNALQFGLIRGESIDTYHDADAVSKSKLTDFRASALLYFRRYVERSLPRKALTPAFRTGQGAHVLTLEGLDAYAKSFCVLPIDAPDRPTKAMLEAAKPSPSSVARQEWWKKFDAELAGRTVLTFSDFEKHKTIRASVLGNPIAAALLSEGEPEVTFRVQASRYAIQCRPDWINFGCSHDLSRRLNALGVRVSPGEPYCVDLKTAASLSDLQYHNFQRNFETLGYHRQGPFYRSVVKSAVDLDVAKFFFASVETSELFQTAVFLPDEQADARGWEEVCRDLENLSACYDSGVWPGVPQTLQSIGLSRRYLRKEGEDAA